LDYKSDILGEIIVANCRGGDCEALIPIAPFKVIPIIRELTSVANATGTKTWGASRPLFGSCGWWLRSRHKAMNQIDTAATSAICCSTGADSRSRTGL
jgi:hypothetical protein